LKQRHTSSPFPPASFCFFTTLGSRSDAHTIIYLSGQWHRSSDYYYAHRLFKRHSVDLPQKMRGNGDASDAAPDSETSPVSLNRKRISEYLHLPRSQPPSRRSSFSKRHASFHSPREVPLPSSPLMYSSQLIGFPFPNPNTVSNTGSTLLDSKGDDSTGLDHSSTGSLHLSSSTQLQPIPHTPPGIAIPDSSPDMKTSDLPVGKKPDTSNTSLATIHEQFSSRPMETQSTQAPMFPFSQPYPSPDGSLSMQPTNRIDGSSTISLPLPLQTPYNYLPRMDDSVMPTPCGTQSPSEASGRRPLPVPPQINAVLNDTQFKLSNANVPSSSQAGWPCTSIPSSPPPPYSRDLCPDDRMHPPALSRQSSNSSSYPAPEAPVILTPPTQAERCGEDAHRRAPYDSFLCHTPPPDTWIAVETSPSEYRLIVRLPGFRRDGITIATRRRRILHVVADSWEPQGGHFERRVLFGYDADLAQVRAEFDGQILRIIIPRRVPAVSWYNHQ
jgi:HSP20 family molecular chaperone IbpA